MFSRMSSKSITPAPLQRAWYRVYRSQIRGFRARMSLCTACGLLRYADGVTRLFFASEIRDNTSLGL